MKKTIVLVFAVSVFAVIACKSAPPPELNPNTAPVVSVEIPELFSPDPDIPNDKMTILISVEHPAPIKDWNIEIQPNLRRSGQGQGEQAGQGGQATEPRQPRAENAEGGGRQRQQGEGQDGEQRQRRRRIFYEVNGKGTPPKEWQWDGKGTSGEMVQSAMDYRFTLVVNDVYDNEGSYEGLIEVDVLVIRDGDDLRIIVPSIVFPANSADLRSSSISEEDQRSNRRVLGLIARSLNKYEDYKVTIEGHANPTTPPATPARTNEERSDQVLSEQRAKAVMDFLVADQKIAQSRLASIGMSCKRPIADYEDDEENWKNRRVEFILQKS